MDFDLETAIYNYFLEKKEQKEDALYIVETDEQNFVVNKKLVAMMLVCPISVNEIMNFNYADIKAQKQNNESKKMITYLSLNSNGKSFYDTMDVEQRSKAFFIALSQLNNDEKPRRYKQERKRITSFCLKHGIKSIDKTSKTPASFETRNQRV